MQSFAALLGALLLTTTARADDVAVDAFLPAPDQASFTGFASTRTPGAWGVDGTLWLDYGWRTLEVGRNEPVQHRLAATAIAQLGIASRGALAVRMPAALVQTGDRVLGEPKLASPAAGNPALDGRIRVYGAPVRPDGSVQDGAALALRGLVHFPVGSSHAYLADDAFRIETDVIWDIELFGIGAGASFGYRHRLDDDMPKDSALAHTLRLSAGVRVPLPLISRLLPGRVQEVGLVELDLGTPARDFLRRAKTPVEGRLGYRVIVGDLFGTVGAAGAFNEAFGNAELRLFGALGWSPRQHDQDADGVVDGRDGCVHLPEDRDGYQDEDGCADDDNDGDLIVDEDDRCPLLPAEMDRDDDEDGCTDP